MPLPPPQPICEKCGRRHRVDYLCLPCVGIYFDPMMRPSGLVRVADAREKTAMSRYDIKRRGDH